MSETDRYHQAVKYIEAFSNTSLRNSLRNNFGENKKDPAVFLDRVRYFLKLLGNPEKGFSYIHVTGTAGKGTVSTMLAEVLVASGKKTGLFTSPYVTTTIEKVWVDGKYIAPSALVDLVEYLKPFIAKAERGPYGGVSAFELFFVIALLYFKQQKCEWVVLEVGLGGRYDATNAITKPIVTAITTIDYDHTEILGKTLREIAYDKAGIIKKGSLFFTSEQRPRLQALFKKICQDVGADFRAIGRQSHYSLYNRELVKAIARALSISHEDVARGLAHLHMPCRFETMQESPLVILDGAHNRAKIRSTISNLKNLSSTSPFKKLYIIAAIADNKNDNRAILKPLVVLPYPTHLVLTQVRMSDAEKQTSQRRTISAQLLLSIANEYIKEYQKKTFKQKGGQKKAGRNTLTLEAIEDHHAALDHVLALAKKDDCILATGSFFLSGNLRKRWVSEEWILKHRKSFK